MSWDESAGRVTRAFDLWVETDRQVRAFLAFNDRWVEPAYQRVWAEAQAEYSAVFDPDRDDADGHVDLFDRKVDGLWPPDYFWKLRCDALRDAVTAFEVYLEKSLSEALGAWIFTDEHGTRSRLAVSKPKTWESPGWNVLTEVHAAFGNDVQPDEVEYIRALRHLLAHQRGELRTQDQRDQFAQEADRSNWMVGEAYVGGDVPLAPARVSTMLEQLGAVVRRADPALWAAAYGSTLPDGFAALVGVRRGPLVVVPLT